MESNKKKLQWFNIAFMFSNPMPGVITLLAENEQDAKDILFKLTSNMKDVEIIRIEDVTEIGIPKHIIPYVEDDGMVHADEIEPDDLKKLN